MQVQVGTLENNGLGDMTVPAMFPVIFFHLASCSDVQGMGCIRV